MAQGFKAFSADRYITMKYGCDRKTSIGIGNRATTLVKGMVFGLRPATSQKGMFRLILVGRKLTQIYSVNAKFANLVIKRSKAVNI